LTSGGLLSRRVSVEREPRIRAELFGAHRLEQHAESLGAAGWLPSASLSSRTSLAQHRARRAARHDATPCLTTC
jgi:hypothetical protein